LYENISPSVKTSKYPYPQEQPFAASRPAPKHASQTDAEVEAQTWHLIFIQATQLKVELFPAMKGS
jgi:hypothetical protein